MNRKGTPLQGSRKNEKIQDACIKSILQKPKQPDLGDIAAMIFLAVAAAGFVITQCFCCLGAREEMAELKNRHLALLDKHVDQDTRYDRLLEDHAKLDGLFIDPHKSVLSFSGERIEDNGKDWGSDTVFCSPKNYEIPAFANGNPTQIFFGILHECESSRFIWEKIPVLNMSGPAERTPHIRCFMLDDGRILKDTCSFHAWPANKVEPPTPVQEGHEDSSFNQLPNNIIDNAVFIAVCFWVAMGALGGVLAFAFMIITLFRFLNQELKRVYHEMGTWRNDYLELVRSGIQRMIKWAQQE